MKWLYIFLLIIGIANGAVRVEWFAGYLMGVIKFATNFTPTPNYPDPAPPPSTAPASPKPD
jgi:hypothetical protein